MDGVTAAFSALSKLASDAGLTLAASLSRTAAEERIGSDSAHLAHWQAGGHAGEMAFMNRPSSLFSNFEKILPSAQSVLIFLVPYAVKIRAESECPSGYGRVARYAWGRDYHRVLKDKLRRFSDSVSAQFGAVTGRSFSDSVPILERSLAQTAGLGFIGRNSMLIRPGWGSFFFIAEYLSDLSIDQDVRPEQFPAGPGSGCGTCQRCLSLCPTDAFVASGVLDARRCISYLTIEKRSQFSEWESTALGEWIFGCDACQTVCPFNQGNSKAMPPIEFQPESGEGQYLSFESILRIRTDVEFQARFGNTALSRTGRTGLVRNCCAVVANTRYMPAIEQLIEIAEFDPSELIRAEARRSLVRLHSDADGLQRQRIKARLSRSPVKDIVELAPSSVVI